MVQETNNIFLALRLTHLVSHVDISPGLNEILNYGVKTHPSSYMKTAHPFLRKYKQASYDTLIN